MSRLLVPMVFSLVTLAASTGIAQDDDPQLRAAAARGLFEQGVEAYDAGRVEEAEGLFRRSLELRHSSAVAFNLAAILSTRGALAEARDLYRGVAADAAAPPEVRAQARERAAELDARVPASGPDPQPDPPQDSDPTPVGDPPSAPAPSGGIGIGPGVAVTVVGVALLANALIFNRVADAEAASFEDTCRIDGDRCPVGFDQEGAAARFDAYVAVGWSSLAVGAAATAVGVVLLAIGLSDGGTEESVSAACTPDGCAASLRGRF